MTSAVSATFNCRSTSTARRRNWRASSFITPGLPFSSSIMTRRSGLSQDGSLRQRTNLDDFEGARCYDASNGSVCFRLDAHMRRLRQSGRICRMEYPLGADGWIGAVLDAVRANGLKACYIRPVIYR